MLPENQIVFLYSALGERIKDVRKKAGYNQTKFAEQLNISRASLVNIEKGRQRAPLHVLYAIAYLLDIEVSALFPKRVELESLSLKRQIREDLQRKTRGNEKVQKALEGFIGVTKSVYE
jgi:transcriptional regulator with XRE-family HTH domain